jgi:hypothetical protein
MRADSAAPLLCSLLAAALVCSGGCKDECLVYDYSPPSVRLQIFDAETGEGICSSLEFFVSTNRGAPISHEDACEWWLPDWVARPDAGAAADESEVVVTVAGYLPETLSIAIPRNECGEIQQPEPRHVGVTPE